MGFAENEKLIITGKSTKNGYTIYRIPNHPYKLKGGYVYAHRFIMECHLGRYLRKDEHIHHLNEIKTDNRIENMTLLTKEEHNRIHHTGKNPTLGFHHDFSDRRCAECGSGTTAVLQPTAKTKNKTPSLSWRKFKGDITGKMYCHKCYMRIMYHIKKKGVDYSTGLHNPILL